MSLRPRVFGPPCSIGCGVPGVVRMQSGRRRGRTPSSTTQPQRRRRRPAAAAAAAAAWTCSGHRATSCRRSPAKNWPPTTSAVRACRPPSGWWSWGAPRRLYPHLCRGQRRRCRCRTANELRTSTTCTGITTSCAHAVDFLADFFLLNKSSWTKNTADIRRISRFLSLFIIFGQLWLTIICRLKFA